MTRTKRTRRGFTLVEVLVAAALAIWGMWLLTWLYQQGLDSFRQAHAQSELTTQLRMTKTVLQRDLTANHFLSDDTKPAPSYGVRLSDQWTDQVLNGGYTPPVSGFFRAGSLPPDNIVNIQEVLQSVSPDGYDSSRSTNHFLQFTVILPGGSDAQQFTLSVPGNAPISSQQQFSGPAAEVVYYLSPAIGLSQTPTGANLCDLYRQQRLVARNSDDAGAYNTVLTTAASYNPPDSNVGDAIVTANNQVRTLSDLTIPTGYTSTTGLNSVRLAGPTSFTPISINSPRYGLDKLMGNVISFEVKFTGPQATGVVWPSDPSTVWPRNAPGNSDYPYDFLPFDGYYDTFSQQVPTATNPIQNYVATATKTTQPIKPIRITGAQIRIRGYDPKTRATRQTTLIVNL